MKNAKISVIITTYMRPFEVIARAIDSALQQTYRNFEVIVVDDSPQSEEREQVQQALREHFGDSITYIKNHINLGACASRNIGFQHSVGEYISFLDDDDEWLPQKNELLLNGFDSDEIGLVYCTLIPFKDEKQITRTRQLPYEGLVLPQLLESNFIGGSSVPMFPRHVLEECGLFDDKFPASQDIDLYVRVAMKYKIRYIATPLVKYYMTKNSITGSQKRQMEGRLMLLRKYYAIYQQYPAIRKRYAASIVSGLLSINEGEQAWNLFKNECGITSKSLVEFSPFIVKGYIKRLLHWCT
ncbi:glycosyltransferase family 2 protein [Sphaerochaeta sp.]|uniref:glycosyltransferase family 2 protein n=1 Tax=Sphaerochaeta sp. TaxID=1972642 RepID=UPI002FC5C642